jgi:cobalt-zinc-cadmium resistance protein CzcA
MSPEALIAASVRHRWLVVLLVTVAVALGLRTVQSMTFDAFPDLTNVQVQVVTSSPGLGAEEVELLVTRPLERSLGGLPGLVEVRSLSTSGVSAITAVFEDDVDRWLARQIVKEQVDLAREEIPDLAGSPQLAPPSTGLGEVWQFTMRSDDRSPAELYRLFQRDVAARLRGVPGVVEVNAWGAGAPQLEVQLDPYRLAAHGLRWQDVADVVGGSVALTPAGAVNQGAQRVTVRAVSNPETPEALANVAVPLPSGGRVRLGDLGVVTEGQAMTIGLGAADGDGPALFAVVQLVAGGDARTVVRQVRERVEEIRDSLPDDVVIAPIYDREKLVSTTLNTVFRSLAEGGLLVVLVLLVLLGDLRAGLLVASVIPLALLGAFVGLTMLGLSGNLMSLGAIDFGLVVDGTIVIVEAIVGVELAQRGTFGQAVVERASAVSRPVLFAVGILLLVYLPILGMQGTEGRLFQPMAWTVLLALATALVLSLTWVPAVASLTLAPTGHHETWLTARLSEAHAPLLGAMMARPRLAAGLSAALVAVSLGVGASLGVEFVPRLEEGDLVLQTMRLPSISPTEALRLGTEVERVVRTFPEVKRVASRIGAPAVATDPMGMEEADVMIELHPHETWTTASTTEGLIEAIEAKIQDEAPGANLVFTQPIEMRFNEMLEGITSDVGVEIHGEDLEQLLALGAQVAAALEAVPGAADVKAPSVEGLPTTDVRLREADLARLGVSSPDVHGLVAGLRRGVEVAQVLRGGWRDPVVLRTSMPTGAPMTDLPIATDRGVVTLGDVADVSTALRPATVRRSEGSRRVIVQANVRGRDLGSFVSDAQLAVGAIDIPDGFWVAWKGRYEQLRDASLRIAITVPAVLGLILLLLYQAFSRWRPAWLIFLNVPVAASGGLLALAVVGLPISMSAVVGLIALSGIAVMNGIVLVSRTAELHADRPARDAAWESARERLRPVVMTASVAGIGFVPMALARGMGAEVQRPLAVVVIGGLVTSTLLTLFLLPSLYARFVPDPKRSDDTLPAA